MRIRTALSITAVAACLLTAVPAASATTDDLQRELDELRSLGLVGVQARVTDNGTERALTSGHADLAGTRPVSPDGKYRIASNTKTFVATVVMQLVAEGRLRLTDTVEQHLPGVVQGNGNDGNRITVRNLLQHTSGLYEYRRDFAPGREGFERTRWDHRESAELVATAVSHPPDFPPGERFAYSNTGYLIAGMIIGKVTGRSWGEEVTDRIITPLGLRDTSVPGDNPFVGLPHARAYQQWGLGGPLTDTTEFNPSDSDAAGSIISTTHDLTRFFQALLRGELLPPAELARMLETIPADSPNAIGYGLGIYHNRLSCGGGYYDHGGNTAGVISRSGFTRDGSRGITLSYTGAHGDSPEAIARLQAASDTLIDNHLCHP